MYHNTRSFFSKCAAVKQIENLILKKAKHLFTSAKSLKFVLFHLLIFLIRHLRFSLHSLHTKKCSLSKLTQIWCNKVNQLYHKFIVYVFVLIFHIDPRLKAKNCREFYFQDISQQTAKKCSFIAISVPHIDIALSLSYAK